MTDNFLDYVRRLPFKVKLAYMVVFFFMSLFASTIVALAYHPVVNAAGVLIAFLRSAIVDGNIDLFLVLLKEKKPTEVGPNVIGAIGFDVSLSAISLMWAESTIKEYHEHSNG